MPAPSSATTLLVSAIPTVTRFHTALQAPRAWPKILVACSPARKCRVTWVMLPVPFKTSTSCVSRSEEHTSELQSLMRISYAVFCLQKKKTKSSTQQTKPKHKSNHQYRKPTD